MEKLLALHPLGQICAFFCGLFAIAVIATRKKAFRVVHINCGMLYYVMASLGFAIGVMMHAQTGKSVMTLWINTHQMIAIILMLLFGTGAGTGFLLFKKGREQVRILRLHQSASYFSICSFVIQGIIGMTLFLNLK
jgi:hypothetical protein